MEKNILELQCPFLLVMLHMVLLTTKKTRIESMQSGLDVVSV